MRSGLQQCIRVSKLCSLGSQAPPRGCNVRPSCCSVFTQTARLRQLGRENTFATAGRKRVSAVVEAANSSPSGHPPVSLAQRETPKRLPITCPGCGAPSQTVYPDEAGFYTPSHKRVKEFLKESNRSKRTPNLHGVASRVPEGPTGTAQESHGPTGVAAQSVLGGASKSIPGAKEEEAASKVPICDRCHQLLHHNVGESVHHPSIESLEETIAESPHKYNHIYHVIDAADFPMSLVPGLHQRLHLAKPRSRNRRAKSHRYVRGALTEVSFIITRADLLAPQKDMVDRLMPYLIEVLRDALGRSGHNVRLGNVRCVSANRGWWTRHVKEDIWRRGGGGWMVGKLNVGKSRLFEEVFPKGRNEDVNIDGLRNKARQGAMGAVSKASSEFDWSPAIEDSLPNSSAEAFQANEEFFDDFADSGSLLPPQQKEVKFPLMPTVSDLPGTTASPIRIPFGNGTGELIDLPGLERSGLERYVKPEHRLELMMKARVVPERITLKPEKSLLLMGGLIRITPVSDNTVFIAHGFVPLKPHLTSTEKAIDFQQSHEKQDTRGVPLITTPEAPEHIKSAGTFELKWDVTKKQSGPLTRKDAVGLKAENLPFIVYAADILIEGCGWVELYAQVRRRQRASQPSSADSAQTGSSFPESPFPEVEVFSPEGRFVGIRQPMNASLFAAKRPAKANTRKSRPRQSMRSVKAQRKPGTSA